MTSTLWRREDVVFAQRQIDDRVLDLIERFGHRIGCIQEIGMDPNAVRVHSRKYIHVQAAARMQAAVEADVVDEPEDIQWCCHDLSDPNSAQYLPVFKHTSRAERVRKGLPDRTSCTESD
jgi:hypothetical protein